MNNEEITSLRHKCTSLETEAHQLECAKRQLQIKLLAIQQSLNREPERVKLQNDIRTGDLRKLEAFCIEKCVLTMDLLKIRLNWKWKQALEQQKHELQMNFHSHLLLHCYQNNQLGLLLRYIWQQLQKANQITEKLWNQHQRAQKGNERSMCDERLQLQVLQKGFENKVGLLLQELKSREMLIKRLQTHLSEMCLVPNRNDTATLAGNIEAPELNAIIRNSPPFYNKAGGPLRNKNRRFSRNSSPYVNQRLPKKRQKCNLENEKMMKELDIGHRLEPHQAFYNVAQQHLPYHQQSNHSQNYHHQQYVQCIGSGLETLPEADSEEESLTAMNDDSFILGTISTTISPSSQISSVDFSFQTSSKLLLGARSIEDLSIEDDCEHPNNHKVSLLESTIQQLQDELRECKDQNELLEFRLLEIQEVSTNSKNGIVDKDKRKMETIKGSCLALAEANVADFDSGAGNLSSNTESRSSCSSDCSDSLSLQESGIFDSQGSDDFLASNGRRSSISRELSSLNGQIEELLRRYDERGEDTNKDKNTAGEYCQKRKNVGNDYMCDLQSCRQKIHEFERRLGQMNDINHLRNLEQRVAQLVEENKRLEEDKAEIEEAENDNRHMCQRMEEKMMQLQRKKSNLQSKLAAEKQLIEQLRIKIFQIHGRETDLQAKITKLEALLQNYEDSNFELEEKLIEIKCSINFVIHSMPIFSLCYFWHLARHLQRRQPLKFNLLLKQRGLLHAKGNNGSKMLPLPNNNCSNGVNVAFTPACPRKHKLFEVNAGVEPKYKKLRSLTVLSPSDEIFECRNVDSRKCSNNAISRGMKCSDVRMVALKDCEAQTGEELGKIFMEEILSRAKVDSEKLEESLKNKIEFLECDIDKCQEVFDSERNRLMEMYELKLSKKEAQLKEAVNCQNEKRELQDKWNCLIQELEQFALYLGKNLKQEKAAHINETQWGDAAAGRPTFYTQSCIHAELLEVSSGNPYPRSTAVTNTTIDFNEPSIKPLEEKAMKGNPSLISILQSTLKDCLATFESREKQLIEEVDRLEKEIKRSSQQNLETESNVIAYLTEENQRLQSLFKDHETVWAEYQQLQDEHERLASELCENSELQKRLDIVQKSESEMRERLEELSRAESTLRTQLVQIERKELRATEKIQQLRDEIQFLRNKCCQLQDDVDVTGSREIKYKNEIQVLLTKLKESTLELEEKESQLESNESALQSQISRLKLQLQELSQSYTDVECSNGMLREEVSYLEKTVEEAVSKAMGSENTITALSHELKQKDIFIEQLQTQLRQLKVTDNADLSPVTPHELAYFNGNDGGLHGVVRGLQEVTSFIQKCNQCESAVVTLMGIVERVIPLIQILKPSHVADFNFTALEAQSPLSRYESDEVLATSFTNDEKCNEDVVAFEVSRNKPQGRSSTEEDEFVIGRLQETMSYLALEISKLEENLYVKTNEMKESHLTETALWRSRCKEKNFLIRLLACRISHLSVTDPRGYFINGIIKEIEKLGKELELANSGHDSKPTKAKTTISHQPDYDFSCDSLCSFMSAERRRIMNLFESSTDDLLEYLDDSTVDSKDESKIDFRVLRRIGDDALLVSWSMPEMFGGQKNICGYEIAVNGSTYLKIPKPTRHKAVLFGLDLDRPLKLTLRCPGDPRLEDSTITFIS